MREAPAIPMIEALLAAGREGAGLRSRGDEDREGHLRVAHPAVPSTSYDALKGADALALVTEWNEFREPDFARMRKLMKTAGHLRRPATSTVPSRCARRASPTTPSDADVRTARTSSTNPLLSVVMPVYNERATIEEIIRRVLRGPDPHPAHRRRRRVEGRHARHPDGAAARSDGSFTLILQPQNQGKGAALRRGFQEVRGDLVVIQDADLEYSPEEFPQLIELICQGRADVVYGSRFLGPAPRVPVHALPRQPAADARHQRALQHDAHATWRPATR